MSDRPDNKEVEAVELSVYYGSAIAVNKVNLPFYRNMITAIIGPSGCGKSTLIKSINRVGEISAPIKVEGKVLFKGKNVYDRDVDVVELRRRVGMVFQKPNPFPKSIYDNVAFGLRLHGRYSKKALGELVEKSLKQAALWDEVKDRIHKSALALSGGQQQRLCIARALAIGPEVILMDEPCSALDPIATAKIEELVLELKKQYTVIIVTHNMQQAARVSDYTGFMLMGELVEFGESSGLFTTPREKLTEDYITGRFG
ncbi:MAG: phosphate ABC transporter ATP-binding protein [Planctomycetes bacterium]|nr:phosphate ABC transporter ATP-binding protein [Planctomycetota bacterium]